MDLEGFEDFRLPSSDAIDALQDDSYAEDAVRVLDEIWYTPANHRARWMDLIGDYAGQEPFIVEGDSLLQIVLDDPFLALGRPSHHKDNSFQILHAYFLLERALAQFTSRYANFSVVFFEKNRHTTLRSVNNMFALSSRRLARKLLIDHLKKLDSSETIQVKIFQDLQDPAWFEYLTERRPMFIMANDGSSRKIVDQSDWMGTLLQRAFLLSVSKQGLSFALLDGTEYKDSKIMSFVFESRPLVRSMILPKALCANITATSSMLDELSPSAPNDLKTQNDTLVSIAQTNVDTMPAEIVFLVIVHILLLPSLSVKQRAQATTSLHPILVDHLLERLLPEVFDILLTSGSDDDPCSIDGRILASLIHFVIENIGGDSNIRSLIGETIYDRAENIWTTAAGSSLDFDQFALDFPSPSVQVNKITQLPSSQEYMLLPFENPVFDDALSSIHVPTTTDDDDEDDDDDDDEDNVAREHAGSKKIRGDTPTSIFGTNILASDTNHWHNSKRSILPSYLGGGDGQSHEEAISPKLRFRRLRKEQRDQSRIQQQAASLTGASGKILERIIIPSPSQRTVVPVVGGGKREKQKPQSSKKDKKVSGADKIKQQKAKEDAAKRTSEGREWWKSILKELKGKTLEEQFTRLDQVRRNPRFAHPPLGMELGIYKVNLFAQRWIRDQGSGGGDREQDVDGEVERLRNSKDASKFLRDLLTVTGFQSYIPSLLPQSYSLSQSSDAEGQVGGSLCFKPLKLKKSSSSTAIYPFMKIMLDPIEWQLRYFGEFMNRSMDSSRDPRVTFSPDRWQRDVLDAVDNDQSLFVIAPTSAGKTFISFYAMEKILRQSDDDILVYVAPTKALVNQIAAEVYGRFSKTASGNRSLLAVFTRDVRMGDMHRAQILITVPEILAILLLSPPLIHTWTHRIKRIIMDEIHSIGQDQTGAVWEQIILMAPCPIIGLSATVGSPEAFNEWLSSVQKSRAEQDNIHQDQHKFILHEHRYSHLRKFFFIPSNVAKPFLGMDQHISTKRLRFLHPISMTITGAGGNSDAAAATTATTILPPDLSLESRDCLALYNSLDSNTKSSSLPSLKPAQFFGEMQELLSQKDVIRYEGVLKKTFCDLSKSDTLRVVRSLQDSQVVHDEAADNIPSKDDFRRDIVGLLCDLNSEDNLPAILFNFDRSDCEIVAQFITHTLEKAEDRWRKRSPQWKQKLEQVERWKAQEKVREAQRQKISKQKKDPDAPNGEDTSTLRWEASFNEDDPSPNFSFAGRNPMSASDLQKLFDDLDSWGGAPPWAVPALKRGVAVHHAGMPKGYRSTIENLFRQGFIRVMIATGSLALGINAPARTTVFCGDSPFLTALMYRQCAGRAGRRGYDLLGNVVFYGLPYSRVQRLVLSRLPNLGGSFPLTPTLILRLFNNLEGSNQADIVIKSIRSILNLPRISHGSNVGRNQVLHHVRFSIEYLRRCGLLNEHGQPMNLFGLCSHLFYTEPSNFALVQLFESGVIHKICEQTEVQAEDEFLLLMCHLFGRKYIPGSFARKDNIARLRKKYPSQIILPPLPMQAARIIREHDKEILAIYSSYALNYAQEHVADLGIQDTLPLSGPIAPASTTDASTSPFVGHLIDKSLDPTVRSLFVANSGLDDAQFHHIHELVGTAREGIHLPEHAIPSMQQFISYSKLPGIEEPVHKLNAYLYDFYNHGQTTTLSNANGIRRGDLWYLLQDFDMTLKVIKSSLQELLTQLSAARRSPGAQGSMDQTLLDVGDGDDDDEDDDKMKFTKPLNTRPEDWAVYRTVERVSLTFSEKFHDMWA